ncbi:hypothetical protein [Amycolatopsis samaneae]|uniref:Uncharacterized protein n=1 Tax=Amycolatopsis samaneae TaxID=664691 RepID=A0ABW5GP63_9PSEU
MAKHHGGPGHDKHPDRKKQQKGHEDEHKDKKGKERHLPQLPDATPKPESPPGGQGAYGLDDGSGVIALLEPPATDASGDIESLLADADVKVRMVDWVFQEIAGESLIDLVIKPITGDFTKIASDAEAWRTIADAMKQFSEVMVRNAEIVGEHWEGPSSTAHATYVNVGWRAGLMAEAGIAKAIGKGFDALADGSRKLAAKALDLLAKLIDTLLEIAAKACVPVVGWVAEVTTVWRAFQLLNLILSVIQMIEDIIGKVQQLWESIQNIGSQLKQIKDIVTGKGGDTTAPSGDDGGTTAPSGDGGGDDPQPPPKRREDNDPPPSRGGDDTTPSGSDEKPPHTEEKCPKCGGKRANGKCGNCDVGPRCSRCGAPVGKGRCLRCHPPQSGECRKCGTKLSHGKCPQCDKTPPNDKSASKCTKCGKTGDWGSSHLCPTCRTKNRCTRCGSALKSGKCPKCKR